MVNLTMKLFDGKKQNFGQWSGWLILIILPFEQPSPPPPPKKKKKKKNRKKKKHALDNRMPISALEHIRKK